jgi:hypothetical protein
MGAGTQEYAFGVGVDPAGAAYAVGRTDGTFSGQASAGNFDAFIAKYDSSGAFQWVRQLGSTAPDQATGASVDSSGSAYVSGETAGGALPGQVAAGGVDAFVAKYDSSGALVWVRQLGTSGDDTGSSVSVGVDGSVFMAGTTWDSFAGSAKAPDRDAFLAKYDATGAMLWVRQLDSEADDYGVGIGVDATGNSYLVGYTYGNIGGEAIAWMADAFVAMYDTAGELQWVRQFGTGASDYGHGVVVDGTGVVYVAGATLGAVGAASYGDMDAFVAAFDGSGTPIGIRQLGTTASDGGNGLAMDTNGRLYLTGTTLGTFAGETSFGLEDGFLTQVVP